MHVSSLQDDVESFMKDPGNSSTSEVMKKLDEQYQKYRYMEGSLTHKKKKWGFVLLCVFL